MKRYEMIKDKDDFNYIIRKGKFIKDKLFVIYYRDNEKENHFTKFGIAIKKSIGSAVTRNRLKRQTRCIVDRNKKMFQKNRDYIIMIREGCLNSSFSEMNESLESLLERI